MRCAFSARRASRRGSAKGAPCYERTRIRRIVSRTPSDSGVDANLKVSYWATVSRRRQDRRLAALLTMWPWLKPPVTTPPSSPVQPPICFVLHLLPATAALATLSAPGASLVETQRRNRVSSPRPRWGPSEHRGRLGPRGHLRQTATTRGPAAAGRPRQNHRITGHRQHIEKVSIPAELAAMEALCILWHSATTRIPT